MAHSSKSRRREVSTIANRRLPVSSRESYYRPPVSNINTSFGFGSLREYEDRRQWHPEGSQRPARGFFNPRHRLTVIDRVHAPRTAERVDASRSFPSLISQTRATVAFADPSRTLICVRRSVRREVLHALRKTGRGSGGSRTDRWTEYSSVRCR